MKRILLIIYITLSFSSSFLPYNGQSINYIQIFFRWPQIVGTTAYELIIVKDNDSEHLLSYSSNSNSILIEDLLDWGANYTWEVCGVDEYSESCFTGNQFTINPLPLHHTNQISILHLNDEHYYEGINVLDFESLGYSLALDKNGNTLWYAEKNNFNDSKIISGELLNNGNFTGFSNGKGYEFTINSEIIFETPVGISVHHQISKTPHNTYFLIDAEIQYHPCPDECDSQFSFLPIPWQGDRFLELNNLGEIIWEWNSFDYIELSEYNPYYAESFNGIIEFDWTHSNSVLYDNISESVFVSIRNLSRVTSIDYDTREINWNLGNSDFMNNPDFENEIGFSQQHSVQITDDRNLIFFDNARFQDPELSRCIEIGFNEEEPFLVWEHVLPDSMFTGSRGECDRLPNNNTLISAGRTGNVIEVDNNNNLIWHLRSLDNNGNNVSIYRTQRVLNLYPNIFSYEIDNLNGEYSSYNIINNSHIDLLIYNDGWIDQAFEYKILDNNEEILSGQIESDSSIINHSIDLNDYNLNYNENYTFRLARIDNPASNQDLDFYFIELNLGDVDINGEVNLLDAIFILDIILDNLEYDINADLNQDMNVDLLDIIIIINIIIT